MSGLLLLGIVMVEWKRQVEFPLEGRLTTLLDLFTHLCLQTKFCKVHVVFILLSSVQAQGLPYSRYPKTIFEGMSEWVSE